MGLTDEAMARLGRRQAEERAFLRHMTRRYETAVLTAERAREMVAAADGDRSRLLAEWVAAPGWSVASVAEHVGLSEKEVADAVKAVRRGAGGLEYVPANGHDLAGRGRPRRGGAQPSPGGAAPEGASS